MHFIEADNPFVYQVTSDPYEQYLEENNLSIGRPSIQPEPEPTRPGIEPDQYAQIDAENIRRLSSFGSRRSQVELDHPRVGYFYEFRDDIPLIPDRFDPIKQRAILVDGGGNPYAIVSNIDHCLVPIGANRIGDAHPEGDVGNVKDASSYPVEDLDDTHLRIQQTSGRVVGYLSIQINGVVHRLAHYALDEVTYGGETVECLDAIDRASGYFEAAREYAGETFDELVEDSRSLRDALNDWWQSRRND